VPNWNGYFYVNVQNNGASRNSYYLMTNWGWSGGWRRRAESCAVFEQGCDRAWTDINLQLFQI